MGGENTTVRNLKVVLIDAENNLLFVKGAVPGANNGIVFIRRN
jgi:large subunit ribosomal protein L3